MSRIKKSNKKAAFVNPVNFYNNFSTTDQLLSDVSNLSPVGDKKGTLRDKNGCLYSPVDDVNGYYRLSGEPDHKDMQDGQILSKFDLLQAYVFGGNFNATATHVTTSIMDKDWPYIMVANDIYKIITQKDEWGNDKIELKPYKRETITLLETKSGIERTSQRFFEDFCVEPNNKSHRQVCGTNYNLYRPFKHKPATGEVTSDDVSYTLSFFRHVFGDQFHLGLQYFKILYEKPTQMLPILVLVSKKRHTGKSTLLDYFSMVFGDNFVQLMASDIMGDFNAHYAYANIIGIDETLVDKVHAVEKIKSLVTSRRIMVNDKFIKSYMLPFYGKIVMTSNKVTDFMKVDSDEIRFWVRKLSPFGKIDEQFFPKLNAEIPAFLRYVETKVETPEYKSRMVFAPEQLHNEFLEAVKEESKSSLAKDIEMRLEEFMLNNRFVDPVTATATDIKESWYRNDSKITLAYIRKVLKEEFEIEPSNPSHYTRHIMGMVNGGFVSTTGRFFSFSRDKYCLDQDASTPGGSVSMFIDPAQDVPF
jgi:hypothetical protein